MRHTSSGLRKVRGNPATTGASPGTGKFIIEALLGSETNSDSQTRWSKTEIGTYSFGSRQSAVPNSTLLPEQATNDKLLNARFDLGIALEHEDALEDQSAPAASDVYAVEMDLRERANAEEARCNKAPRLNEIAESLPILVQQAMDVAMVDESPWTPLDLGMLDGEPFDLGMIAEPYVDAESKSDSRIHSPTRVGRHFPVFDGAAQHVSNECANEAGNSVDDGPQQQSTKRPEQTAASGEAAGVAKSWMR